MAEEQSNHKNSKIWMRPMVCYMIILGSFTIFGMVARGYVEPAWKTEVNLVVGACIVYITKILDYVISSTLDSGKKTDLLAERRAT